MAFVLPNIDPKDVISFPKSKLKSLGYNFYIIIFVQFLSDNYVENHMKVIINHS